MVSYFGLCTLFTQKNTLTSKPHVSAAELYLCVAHTSKMAIELKAVVGC